VRLLHPGMVLATVALLARDPSPDDAAIDAALEGNLCRCGTYARVRRAVRRATELSDDPVVRASSGPVPIVPPWSLPVPGSATWRPARPFDLTAADQRDWFSLLGDGLVVVLPARVPPAGMWPSDGGAWLHVTSEGRDRLHWQGRRRPRQPNGPRNARRRGARLEIGQVRLVMGDTDLCPYDMGTFGSRSMPGAGAALRRLASFARPLLPSRPGRGGWRR